MTKITEEPHLTLVNTMDLRKQLADKELACQQHFVLVRYPELTKEEMGLVKEALTSIVGAKGDRDELHEGFVGIYMLFHLEVKDGKWELRYCYFGDTPEDAMRNGMYSGTVFLPEFVKRYRNKEVYV